MGSQTVGRSDKTAEHIGQKPSHFSRVKYPLAERTKQHKLLDIIIIAICGTICGADRWVAIEQFGKAKEAWLKWKSSSNLIAYLYIELLYRCRYRVWRQLLHSTSSYKEHKHAALTTISTTGKWA